MRDYPSYFWKNEIGKVKHKVFAYTGLIDIQKTQVLQKNKQYWLHLKFGFILFRCT